MINRKYVPNDSHIAAAAAVVLAPFGVFLPPFASFAVHSQGLELVDAFAELSPSMSTLR